MTEHNLEVALDILNDCGPEELLPWAWSVLELCSPRVVRSACVPNRHAVWQPAESSASGAHIVSKSGKAGVLARWTGSREVASSESMSGSYWMPLGRATSASSSWYSYYHARYFTQVFLEEKLGRRVN